MDKQSDRQQYFDDLKARLKTIPAQYPIVDEEPVAVETPKVTLWMKVRPYIAMAAAFACIVAAGTGVMRYASSHTTKEAVQDEVDQYLYSDVIPVTDPYLEQQYAEEEYSESDDAVSYLINSEVPVEYIAYLTE